MKHYLGKIAESTLKNVNYREVLYTGPKMQLVVMALDPGEEIGEEIHAEHDQFFRLEAGEGKVVLDGTPHDISVGDVLIVPAGMRHNVINTSADSPMKLYTIYAPPEHRPETVHPRKQDEIA